MAKGSSKRGTSRLRGTDRLSDRSEDTGARRGTSRVTGRSGRTPPAAPAAAAAPAPTRSSRRSRMEEIEEKANRQSKRRSKRSSRREEESRSVSVDERKERAAVEAQKRRKKTIIYAVIGGVAVLTLLIFSGTIRRALLFRDLRDSNQRTRWDAVQGLLRYKESVRSGFENALRNSTGDWPDASRLDAARALALLHLTPANKALIELGAAGGADPKADDVKLRLWVMQSLGDFLVRGDAKAADFPAAIFLENTASQDAATRAWATKALSMYRGSEIVDAIFKMLRDPETAVRLAAIDSFKAAATPRDTIQLIEFLNSELVERRDAAQAIFQHFDNATTITVLGEALEKADEPVALAILQIFKGFNSFAGMPEAISKAIANPVLAVRLKALEVAGYKQLKGTEAAILEATRADIADVREAAAKAVKALGQGKLAHSIHHLLEDGEAKVRRAAIDAIMSLQDTTAAEALVKLTEHDDAETVDCALGALRALFPLSTKKFGGRKASTWKTWWERYGKQMEFVNGERDLETKLKDLLGNQNNESYKRVVELIDEHRKWIQEFLVDKDVIPEILEQYKPFLEELASEKKMGAWRYTAMKHQTN